jgi:hypothetical protein
MNWKPFMLGLGLSLSACLEVTQTTTFHEDVQPLIQKHCQGCHVTGGIAPFPLETYEDALEHAAEIEAAVLSREMPPWHADEESADCGQDFNNSKRLREAEINTISEWVIGGSLRGNPALAPEPKEPAKKLARVDLTADMGIEYTPDDTLTDDYRCFVVDLGLAEDTFLSAYEVRPGQPRVVHHMNTWMALTPEDSARADALDEADPRPGYECFAGPLVEALPVILWAPGDNVVDLSGGAPGLSGIRIKAGSKLIMQVHYNLSAGALPDRSQIDLMLEDSVAIPTIVGAIRDQDMNLQPGQDIVETSESLLVESVFDIFGVEPRDIRIFAFGGHMHFRGRTLRVDVDHADGTSECIGAIPDWDFHWQNGYFYENPPTIKPSDTVRVTCTFDTSDDTAPIFYGENTTDEMCVGAFYISL